MIKSKITMAIVAALALGYGSAYAQSAPTDGSQQSSDQQGTSQQQAPDAKKAKRLQEVTVTGSLIPSSQIETAQPIITITADQLKARGFATVAEALQQSSFATGAVQNAQDTNSFTPGAQTLSLFGLSVGFTKFLVDGRPLGNFPALYNGTDTFNSLSGIPVDMVDHIDILPGGQSSLYGSDAIAGVINIVLKKHLDAPVLDVRYGWDQDGGGANNRISLADSFTFGKFNSLIGIQFSNVQPIYRKDRDITSHFFTGGTTPATASRDELVLSVFNADGTPTGYQFLDPNNCSNLSGLWGGTETKQYRQGSGYYCGSQDTPGAGTLDAGRKHVDLYTHNTFDVNDNVQLYGDLLYDYSETTYTNGASTSFWGSNVEAANGATYFYDPTYGGGSLLLLQKAFAPEEVGGYSNQLSKDTENAVQLTFGVRGTFGQSNWDYDLNATHSDDHLIQKDLQRESLQMEQYFSDHVLGKQLGTYYGYPVYEPNFAGLYTPVSKADYDSFTSYSINHSKTWYNMLRGQLTNASLFSLPGGDAGIAVVLEGGNEGLDISPDPRFAQTVTIFNGSQEPYFWGTSSTPAAGHRSRSAATVEMKFPLLSQVTLDTSGRYDDYLVSGQHVNHGTYNLGLEYRPLDWVLLRGRYGTAFKVPTLSDEFQLPSGGYSSVYDYLNCGRLHYSGPTQSNCPAPYNGEQYQLLTYGNPALKPITAKVWSYGFVLAPIEHMSISVDYLHFNINNEVGELSATQLSNTEYLCDIGTIEPTSATCTQAFSYVTRGPGRTVDGVPLLGEITNVVTPKLNIANEQVNAIQASFSYLQSIGSLGSLSWSMSYNDELKHTYQDYVTDPHVNYLTNPNYSTDFKSKANASMTWLDNKWSTTLFVNRYGRTPNYAAQVSNGYTAAGAGKLGAWILWNSSVTYNPIKSLGLSFLVDNLFNRMPPIDHTLPGTTYIPYNQDNYNPYGRAYFLEANYKFGQGN